MRGLSLWQPWASLVALGHKQLETRSWFTNYRGPLLIHATAGGPTDYAKRLWDVNQVLAEHGREPLPAELPRGAVIAVACLAEVVKADFDSTFPPLEREFGDLNPGRFAFRLESVVALADPVKVSGRQGLWVPSESLCNEIVRRSRGRAAG